MNTASMKGTVAKMANREFGLLGHPLGHTMSPPIHQELFALSGGTGGYSLFDIPTGRLASEMPRLLNLRGFNVTIPHKQAVIPYLDGLSPTARRYGAVNTVDIRPGAGAIGHNTDIDGFLHSVRMLGADLGGSVCVVGCGGAGRMFAIESALRGAQVTLAAREGALGKAQAAARDARAAKPGCRVFVHTVDELARLPGRFELLINATPAGMHPHTGKSPVNPEILARCRCVFDSIYNPSETLLLKQAKASGCAVLSGMAMLVWQAAAAHVIWDGAAYDPGDIDLLIGRMRARVDKTFPSRNTENG